MSDRMIDQFKSFEDLSAFARAQQKTLIDLTKKNKAFEEEIKQLKKLLNNTIPVLNDKPQIDFSANDEEAIAREQLYRLRDLSKERELNLEETKRVEIYSKILGTLKDKPRDITPRGKQLNEGELLTLLSSKKSDDSNS